MKKIAVLSNINMTPVAQGLKASYEVFQNEGYGNELEMLLNSQSALWDFQPEVVFLVVDILELAQHQWNADGIKEQIHQWFAAVEASLREKVVFVISDICFRGRERQICSDFEWETDILQYWQEQRAGLQSRHAGVYGMHYRRLMESLGESAYSDKMWYLGKIIHSRQGISAIQGEIRHILEKMAYTPKKLLLLDLDNTLWGGLAGERDKEELLLSEEKAGLLYKDLQRVILAMKKTGVMLGIVSKNNEEDALSVIRNHPHMVLREEDFVIYKINWQPKSDNIREIAAELNIGTDSIVFFDDSAQEREEICRLLPEVTVPEFPEQRDKLPETMAEIYRRFFDKLSVTEEDRQKTEQYRQEKERKQWQADNYAADYTGYLKSLAIRVVQRDVQKNSERILQLLNKTNQFNLTTRRYEAAELLEQLQGENKQYYAFSVSDCFGDAGIVGILGVTFGSRTEIEDFVMSCRVMGRQIEACMLEMVEQDAWARGSQEIYARYIPTAKNKPVAKLYDTMGYERIEESTDGEILYRLSRSSKVDREYYVAEKTML